MYEEYREYWQNVFKREREEILKRKTVAMSIARTAAHELYSRFNVEKVYLFGSLVYGDHFGLTSDIDIAAKGLDPKDEIKAFLALEELGGKEFKIDLVCIEDCYEHIANTILKEGVLFEAK